MQGKYLVTTDQWFVAPDGKLYRAVWGDVQVLEDTMLGVKTNRNATNWYAKIGSESKHIIIAGCQIHYSVRCEEKPNTKEVEDLRTDEKGMVVKPSMIYIAE